MQSASSSTPASTEAPSEAGAQKAPSRAQRWAFRSGRFGAKALVAACALGALYFVGAFVWVAFHRLRYEFDLEWMEGGVLDHIYRVAHGQRLYVPPSVDFVPFLYNPFYYVAAVPFTWVLGVGYFAARLLSFLSTLACIALIFAIVWQSSRARLPALVAAGFYAGTFVISGAWFDLARVDSLFIALCLGAYLSTRSRRVLVGTAVSAFLTFLAFETKQVGLALVPGLAVALFFTRGTKYAVYYVLGSLVPVVCVTWYLYRATDGWYWFYAFTLPAGHETVADMYTFFWKVDVFAELPVAMLFTLLLVFLKGDARAMDARRTVLPFALTLIAMAYVTLLHSGSFLNDKMPLHAALAVTMGVGLAALFRVNVAAEGLRLFGASAVLCQFAVLLYPPLRFIPTAADFAEVRHFYATLSRFEGPILATQHGFLTRRLGKPTFAHGMATFDLQRAKGDPRGAFALTYKSYEDAISNHRFAAIVTDDGLVLNDLVERHYYLRGDLSLIRDPRALQPKTGPGYRPRNVYVPRP